MQHGCAMALERRRVLHMCVQGVAQPRWLSAANPRRTREELESKSRDILYVAAGSGFLDPGHFGLPARAPWGGHKRAGRQAGGGGG